MRRKSGNIVDSMVILLLALCLASVMLRWRERQTQNESAAPYTLTVTAKTIAPQIADCIAVGETVYSEAGSALGSVTGIWILPAEVSVLSNGVYRSGEWAPEHRVTLNLELTVEAVDRGKGPLLGGTLPLSVGQTLVLCTQRAALQVTLYQISPLVS